MGYGSSGDNHTTNQCGANTLSATGHNSATEHNSARSRESHGMDTRSMASMPLLLPSSTLEAKIQADS